MDRSVIWLIMAKDILIGSDWVAQAIDPLGQSPVPGMPPEPKRRRLLRGTRLQANVSKGQGMSFQELGQGLSRLAQGFLGETEDLRWPLGAFSEGESFSEDPETAAGQRIGHLARPFLALGKEMVQGAGQLAYDVITGEPIRAAGQVANTALSTDMLSQVMAKAQTGVELSGEEEQFLLQATISTADAMIGGVVGNSKNLLRSGDHSLPVYSRLVQAVQSGKFSKLAEKETPTKAGKLLKMLKQPTALSELDQLGLQQQLGGEHAGELLSPEKVRAILDEIVETDLTKQTDVTVLGSLHPAKLSPLGERYSARIGAEPGEFSPETLLDYLTTTEAGKYIRGIDPKIDSLLTRIPKIQTAAEKLSQRIFNSEYGTTEYQALRRRRTRLDAGLQQTAEAIRHNLGEQRRPTGYNIWHQPLENPPKNEYLQVLPQFKASHRGAELEAAELGLRPGQEGFFEQLYKLAEERVLRDKKAFPYRALSDEADALFSKVTQVTKSLSEKYGNPYQAPTAELAYYRKLNKDWSELRKKRNTLFSEAERKAESKRFSAAIQAERQRIRTLPDQVAPFQGKHFSADHADTFGTSVHENVPSWARVYGPDIADEEARAFWIHEIQTDMTGELRRSRDFFGPAAPRNIFLDDPLKPARLAASKIGVEDPAFSHIAFSTPEFLFQRNRSAVEHHASKLETALHELGVPGYEIEPTMGSLSGAGERDIFRSLKAYREYEGEVLGKIKTALKDEDLRGAINRFELKRLDELGPALPYLETVYDPYNPQSQIRKLAKEIEKKTGKRATIEEITVKPRNPSYGFEKLKLPAIKKTPEVKEAFKKGFPIAKFNKALRQMLA